MRLPPLCNAAAVRKWRETAEAGDEFDGSYLVQSCHEFSAARRPFVTQRRLLVQCS
jgi:hypothetical protein